MTSFTSRKVVQATSFIKYQLEKVLLTAKLLFQTSLRQFLQIFDLSLARSAKSPIPNKRIANIIDYLTFEVFRYTTRGLYEEHKFLYVLLLTLKIALNSGQISHTEFQTFIKGQRFVCVLLQLTYREKSVTWKLYDS